MSSVEVKQAPTWVLYPRAIERGRNWVIRRSITDRLVASEEAQYHTCDPESSDEVSESQMMKVTISLKSGQAKFSGPTEQEDTARYLNVQGMEGFVPVAPSVLASGPRGLTSGMERQALGKLEGSFSKKWQGAIWGKEVGRSGSVGAAAPACTPAVL